MSTCNMARAVGYIAAHMANTQSARGYPHLGHTIRHPQKKIHPQKTTSSGRAITAITAKFSAVACLRGPPQPHPTPTRLVQCLP